MLRDLAASGLLEPGQSVNGDALGQIEGLVGVAGLFG